MVKLNGFCIKMTKNWYHIAKIKSNISLCDKKILAQVLNLKFWGSVLPTNDTKKFCQKCEELYRREIYKHNIAKLYKGED